MKLTERLNVLIQATTLSQKSGVLTLDEAVKAKNAIDIISSGKLNQNLAAAINSLIEIVVASQKKGAFSLKDAHMIFIAVDGIETEFQNEVNRFNEKMAEKEMEVSSETPVNNNETIVTVAPKTLKKNS
jgi:hypothetical protein